MREQHGMSNTRLYRIWKGMRSRCNNPNLPKYNRYGGRGITVCDEWNSFTSFYRWVQTINYNDELQLDRINNDGNYEPSNCRFVTIKENTDFGRTHMQNNNTSGVIGVHRNKQCGDYMVHFKRKYIGRRKCFADAVALRVKVENEYLGGL